MSDSNEDRFSRRPDPYSYWIPWAVQSLPKSPPIQPVRPYMRNLRGVSEEEEDGAGKPMICGVSERDTEIVLLARSVPLLCSLDVYCFAFSSVMNLSL